MVVFENDLHSNQNGNYWIFHYGKFIDGTNEYDFSLLEMVDENFGTSSFEITFIEEKPANQKLAEKEILEKFNTLL